MKLSMLALFVAALSLGAKGAELQKLISDTQRAAEEPSRLTLVWWIPTEFWEITTRNNPAVTDEARAMFRKVMDEYLLFIITVADVGPMGGMSHKDRAAIEANTELLIAGKAVGLVEKDKMSADALNFISMMKPMMANMLGQFGQSMEFFVYPNPMKSPQRVSAVNPGNFYITSFGNQFEWRLPLGSLLPPKVDLKTNQVFPGDYLYNPYTGDKLTVQ
jgi:hypothetical protein